MKIICSKKKIVQFLLESCYKYGVRNVVISPGSRNAPLTISFSQNPLFNCYSIPDERSAAFYALGMAKQLNEPVVILCTSGTATLNYAPGTKGSCNYRRRKSSGLLQYAKTKYGIKYRSGICCIRKYCT